MNAILLFLATACAVAVAVAGGIELAIRKARTEVASARYGR